MVNQILYGSLVCGRRDPPMRNDLTVEVYKDVHTLPPTYLNLRLLRKKHNNLSPYLYMFNLEYNDLINKHGFK